MQRGVFGSLVITGKHKLVAERKVSQSVCTCYALYLFSFWGIFFIVYADIAQHGENKWKIIILLSTHKQKQKNEKRKALKI